jgi:hypothetical protein
MPRGNARPNILLPLNKSISMITNIHSPLQLLVQYVDCFDDADDTKAKIDLLLDTALSSTGADGWTADERSDLIFFCRQTQQLLTVLFRISEPLSELYNTLKPSENETVRNI